MIGTILGNVCLTDLLILRGSNCWVTPRHAQSRFLVASNITVITGFASYKAMSELYKVN